MSTVALDHYKNRYLVNALSEAERKAEISAVELRATYGKLQRAKGTFNAAHTTRDKLRNELNSSIRLANGCNSTDQKEEKESIADWKLLKMNDDEGFEGEVVEGEKEFDEDVDVDVDELAEFEDEEDEEDDVDELDEANSKAKICKATEEYLQYIWTAQEKMENGLIKEARRAELKATKVLDLLDSHIDAKLIFSKGENTVQVSAADLLRPRSFLRDEDVTLALSAAAEFDDSEIYEPFFLISRFFKGGGAVDWNVLEFGAELANIQRFHLGRNEGIPFEMNAEVWESLQIAMKNKVVKNKEVNAAQLKPPHADSALIARYNHDAHFKSETTEAIASADLLHDSLSHCKLRSRKWTTDPYDDRTTRMGKIPFEFPSYKISGFDIDGDLLAMCGNRHPRELRHPRNFVGFSKVLCPVKLASMGDIYSNTTTCLYRGRSSNSDWFASCVADAANGKIWAASSNPGTIHGFSLTEVVDEGDDDDDNYDDDEEEEEEDDDDCSRGENTKTKKAAAAVVTESGVFVPKLTFREQEIASAKKFCTHTFKIAKSDQHIFGSAGTNCLSVWSIDKALRGEESDSASKGMDVLPAKKKAKTNYSSSSTNNDSSPSSAEQFLQPQIIVLDGSDNFATGDVQWLGGSRVLVAPLRTMEGDIQSKALRLVDVEAEAVVGLFCGNQRDVSIEKQYCVDTHNLVFSTDGYLGLVWDIRTYRPSFMLHTDGHGQDQILGVPTGCATVAFTFSNSDESISCWDLRMPAYQAYTMATGNTVVDSLLWHERTASLLAATHSKHSIMYGKYSSQYMYGEPLEEDVEGIDESDWWPKKSVYEESYFSERWHCDCSESPRVLQYAFQNGTEAHDSNIV